MPTNISQNKLEKLKKLLELTNEGLTREEFLESFKQVVDQILKLESKLIQKIDYKTSEEKQRLETLKEEFENVIAQAKEESDNSLSGFKRKTIELVNSLFIKSKVNQKLAEVLDITNLKLKELDTKMMMVRDGKDADETKIINEILNKIKMPEKETEIEDIKGLKEALERLETTRRLGGGGGLSKIALESKMIDGETPSGTVNGVTTDFTLANMPNPSTSLKVFVNGMRMSLTEDYTFSGKVITFLTAPPTGSIIRCDYRK